MRLSPLVNFDAADNAAMVTKLALADRVIVTGCEMETLNNEQSTAIGGVAANEFVPELIVFHVEDVGSGAAANGDIQVSVGNSSGGTQILVATALTNLISLNQHFIVAIDGLTNTILANSTLYVKVTTKDTTAGAGHLLDAYILGTIVVSGT
jgi:hypothetical protein